MKNKFGIRYPSDILYTNTHREEARIRARKWYADNRERSKITAKVNKLRRRNAGGSFTHEDWKKILDQQLNCCIDCGREFYEHLQPTIGHAIPIIRGGTNHPSNIIAQCWQCNRRQYTNIHSSRVAL